MIPPPCHMDPARGRVNSPQAQAYPLPQLLMYAGDVAQRKGAMASLLGLLDVERAARYRPSLARTLCNLYAHDWCHQLGAFLPRVWWNSEALKQWEKDNPQPVAYPHGHRDGTIRELNANSLHDWLAERGKDHGWRVVQTAQELQKHVDETGRPAVISARNATRKFSGHITCVLPDQFDDIGPEGLGTGYAPLQTQAGRVNRRRFASGWWRSDSFDSVVFAAYHGQGMR